MNNEKYIFDKKYLSSRPFGANVRNEWISMLSNDQKLTVNFKEVESISDSFADELFGIISLQIGESQLFEKIKLSNITESCLQTIAEAIHKRTLSQQAA